jgi:CRP/FNR family cyclic AMP-dependent transcriptional regulator
MDTRHAVRALSEAPLFAGLDKGAIEAIVEQASVREFSKGSHLFHQGDPGDAFFLLTEGAVKVFVSSSQGDEMVLATLRAPDALGEVALLDLGERSASAVALEKTTAIAFARSTILDLMRAQPQIGDAMLRAAGRLLRRLTGQAADLVFLDLEGRVAKLLVNMAEERGQSRDGIVSLDLGVTQTDLARMVGGSRQSVNQILHDLEGRGLVHLDGRRVDIMDDERLRRRAGSA